MGNPFNENCIVYDGECPLCTRYVAMVRLRDAIGPISLINARNGGPVVEGLRSCGYSLDQGMVLILNGSIYHGSECINRLALLSSRSTAFNRVNAFLFSRVWLSDVAYPLLRAGRFMALRMLGRQLMGDEPQNEHPPTMLFRNYRKSSIILFVTLFLYACVAEVKRLPIIKHFNFQMIHSEVFPFFNWNLFSHPARYFRRYTIEPLDVAEGSPLAAMVGHPIGVEDASFMRDIRFHKTGRRLSAAVVEGDQEEIEATKLMLSNFVRSYGVRKYRVVEMLGDPLVRERNVIVSTRVLATFNAFD